jgi:hypothetical protein
MAWSLEDLAGWLEDTVDTFRGKNRNKPGGEAIYQGAIQPLKMASDVTGFTQGVRGVSPGASPMEKAMGLLAMLSAGTAGAGADDIARVGVKAGGRVRDVVGPKATMYHGSPVSGIEKLIPKIAPAAGTAYGKPTPYVYLADPDSVENVWSYLQQAGMKGFGEDTRNVTGSIYKAQVPKWRLEDYGSVGSKSHWGKRSSVPVKVKQELAFDKTPRADALKAFKNFIR